MRARSFRCFCFRVPPSCGDAIISLLPAGGFCRGWLTERNARAARHLPGGPSGSPTAAPPPRLRRSLLPRLPW